MEIQQKKVLAGFAAVAAVLFTVGVISSASNTAPLEAAATTTTAIPATTTTTTAKPAPVTTAKPATTTTKPAAVSPVLSAAWSDFLGKVSVQSTYNAETLKRGNLLAGQQGCMDLVKILMNAPKDKFADAVLEGHLRNFVYESTEMSYACIYQDVNGVGSHITIATAELKAAQDRLKLLTGS